MTAFVFQGNIPPSMPKSITKTNLPAWVPDAVLSAYTKQSGLPKDSRPYTDCKITGDSSITIAEGYSGISVPFKVVSKPAPTITLSASQFKWNGKGNTLLLPVGQMKGSYPVKITVSNGIGIDAEFAFTLKVIQPKVTGIKTIPFLHVVKGRTVALPFVVSPANATNKAVTWKSSKQKVATVTDGKIRGVSTGMSTITLTTIDGRKTAKCSVVVAAKATALKSVKTTPAKTATMKLGKTLQIKIALSPKTASGIIPVYGTDKPGVATVDKLGKVTAVAKGKATITIKVGSKSMKIAVTVK